MDFAKGDRVVTTKQLEQHKAGTLGRVILVDVRMFSATRYSVLLDDSGEVLEDLKEEDLFGLDGD